MPPPGAPTTKRRKFISSTCPKPTSDITNFLERDQADTHTQSVRNFTTATASTVPTTRSVHSHLTSAYTIKHKYPNQTGCIFHKKTNFGVPTGSLLRAIESEINRHTAEVKHQKAFDHLSVQGRTEKKDNVLGDGGIALQAAVDGEPAVRVFTNKIGTIILSKASSLDMEIKQRLIRPTARRSISQLLHVPTKKKLARRIQKQLQSEEALLKINPFHVNKDLDLLELREMYHQSKRSRPHEPPTITNDAARIQYQILNDTRLLQPVFNFRKTKYMEERKHRVRIQDETVQSSKQREPLFRFRDVPQLLAVTCKNRRMYRETKWDVMGRIREMNQCNISLAIKRRMIDYLNRSVTKFDKDILKVEEETEKFAKIFDEYLHQNDNLAIAAIYRAQNAVTHREAAERALKEVQCHNNLLSNHNIRTAERIRFLDRFINILYATVPEVTRVACLATARTLREEHQVHAELTWNVEGDCRAQHRSVAESLARYASLSEESEADWEEGLTEEELYNVPPLPVEGVTEAMQCLTAYQQRCAEACRGMTGVKEEVKNVQDRINEETEAADQRLTAASTSLQLLEEEVLALNAEVDSLQLSATFESTNEQNRETFRRPIHLLHSQIRDVYLTYIDASEENSAIGDMLSVISRKISSHQAHLQQHPQKYVRKWFETVQTNQQAEQKIINTLEKKARWEQVMLDRSIQLPDVLPHRLLRPRSVPHDHGKAGAITSKEPLDEIVEDLQKVIYKVEEKPLTVGEGVQEAGSTVSVADVLETTDSWYTPSQRRVSSFSGPMTAMELDHDDDDRSTAIVIMPLNLSTMLIAGGENMSDTKERVDSQTPAEASQSVTNASTVETVKIKTDEAVPEEIVTLVPVKLVPTDYPLEILNNENDRHRRLDDIFDALNRHEVPPVEKPRTPAASPVLLEKATFGEVVSDSKQSAVSPPSSPVSEHTDKFGSQSSSPVTDPLNTPSSPDVAASSTSTLSHLESASKETVAVPFQIEEENADGEDDKSEQANSDGETSVALTDPEEIPIPDRL